MAKASVPKVAAPAPQPAKTARTTVAVTYRPLNAFDPNVVKWNGITFRANEPVQIDPKNKAHGYLIPMPKEYAGPDGEVHTKHRDTWVSMIETAKDNPSFEVEGFPRAKVRKSKRVVPPPGAEWADQHEDEVDVEEAAA
jgi:hypothetical protein